ncbi:hypothetical protein ACF0H5_007590 [Mactra antiquata]
MGARPSFPIVSIPRERIVIVTGGNTGLGYEISKWIAVMGATVIIACRSEERARQAIERMQKEYEVLKGEMKDKHELAVYDKLAVEFMPLNLISMQSTLDFVQSFKSSGRKLHILICNAGIGMAPFERTADGFEKMLQVNYLGHFVMVAKLLPIMRTSGEDCRMLFMSSDGHRSCRFNINTINYDGQPDKFGRLDYYGRTKLYQIMQMHCLVRRLKNTNVTINSSHPGIVETEINRNFEDSFFWNTIFFGGTKLIGKMKTPIEGATSIINAAVNPALTGVNGIYYYDCKSSYTTGTARNEQKQEALWEKTLELLKDHITTEELNILEGRT